LGVHLRELELARHVVVDAMPVRVALDDPDARLARAVAGALHAAERHVGLGTNGGVVYRGHTGLDVLLEVVRPLPVVRVDGGRQAVVHGVGRLNRLLDAVDLDQVDRGSEDLGLEELHTGLHAFPHGGPAVVGRAGVADVTLGGLAILDTSLAVEQSGAFRTAPLVVLLPVLVEALVNERSVEHTVVLVGVANTDLLHALQEPALELVVDGGVYDYVAGRGATLATGAERREDGALDGVVQVCVAHDDQRVLAAQLQRRVQQVATRHLPYVPAHGRAAREGELVEETLVHHVDEELAGCALAAAEHDVQHAGWHPGLLDDLGEGVRDGRGVLAGLPDDRVAGDEGGDDLPRRHGDGEVAGRDD